MDCIVLLFCHSELNSNSTYLILNIFQKNNSLFPLVFKKPLVDSAKDQMDSNKVFGQGGKVGESDKLNIDSIIARLLEGKAKH